MIADLKVLLKSLVSLSRTVVLLVGTPVIGRFQQSLSELVKSMDEEQIPEISRTPRDLPNSHVHPSSVK